jgi:ABC-type molybdate transport system substrate-binding protein
MTMRSAMLPSALVAFSMGAGLACHGQNREVTFAAAASLRQVLPKLIDACEKKHPGAHFVATYGASGDLEKQVEAGAPIDAVIFASGKPVDELIADSRVDKATRRVVAPASRLYPRSRSKHSTLFQKVNASRSAIQALYQPVNTPKMR